MPKMTAKYSSALTVARREGVGANVTGATPQETLYTRLQERGYFWNSDRKEWERHEISEANPPMEGISIRVWAATEHANKAAQAVAFALGRVYGWRLVETSEPYQCRPPKQLESRVYLKFMPPEEK